VPPKGRIWVEVKNGGDWSFGVKRGREKGRRGIDFGVKKKKKRDPLQVWGENGRAITIRERGNRGEERGKGAIVVM